MSGPCETGSCRWKYKKSGGIGLKSSFCANCVEQDDLGATTLRSKMKSGELVLEGSCLHKGCDDVAPAADAPTRGRSRGRTARFEAEPTGKMNRDRSKASRIKSRKRRKSIEDVLRVEGVLKREVLKQLQGNAPKKALVWSTVAYIAGKENMVLTRIERKPSVLPSRSSNLLRMVKARLLLIVVALAFSIERKMEKVTINLQYCKHFWITCLPSVQNSPENKQFK